jgi:ABC-type polysaccharide/polyol phosphate export systems, permease component
MFVELVKKDFKGKYRNSVLGYLWHIINPLSTILVFGFVFTAMIIGRSITDYWIYLPVGMLAWSFFAASLEHSTNCLVRNHNLVNKMYFPREILVFSSVVTNLIVFTISYCILMVIIPISNVLHLSSVELNFIVFPLIPIIMILETIFVIGLGLMLSALNVYRRDVSYGVGIVVFLWMWLTPIIYETGGDTLLTVINQYNPMTYFVESFHALLYHGTFPAMLDFLLCVLLAFSALVAGLLIFKKLEPRFSEKL